GTREGLALSPPFTSKDSNPESRSPRIGGWGAFSPENGQSLSADPPEAIHQTALTQPAIFALEYALAQLWLSWGVQPDAVMGHSIGEYVAACVAGVFSLEEGLRLVAARGRLMQALPAGCGMVAVMASANQVAGLLPEQVAIAAVNGPESIVLSGPLEALDKVVATLTQQDIKTKALPVSHAFHSPLMEPMLAEFREVARTVNYQPPRLELVSLMDEGSNVASAEHWVRHVRQPVQFAAGVNQLVASGYNTFIELGAKPILLSMGRGCIPELDALLLPSLRPEAGWQTLLTSLGQLYAAGADVDWAAFDRAYPRQIVQLPNYPFQRQRYWVDAPGNSSFVIASSSALSASDRPTDHPLLGHPLPLAGAVRYFQARLRPDAPGYLQDHRVFGAAVMPAAGYLESAIAAARSRLSGPLMLQDVSLLKRLVLPEGGVLTQTVLTPLSDDRLKFEMFSQAPSDAANSDPWHRHAEGQIELATSAPRQLSLAAKQNELQGEMAAADFYHTYRQRGIDYGPRFQVLERIWLGTGEALASLREDKRDRAYHVHPVLLDAGLQLAGAALAQTSMTYLPVRVGRLTWFDMDDAPRWVHAKQREGAAGSSVIDVHLLAADGQAVATLSGLVLQQVTSAGLETLQPTAADTTWLYQVTWQPQPLPDRLETLQPPAVICDRLAPEFARLLAQPKFKAYQALLPQLDALALSYSRQALEELGWSAEMGHCDVNQLAIAPQHTALAQRLLDVLAERDVRLYDNAELRTAAGAELKLLTRCGENLAAVLRGDVDPLTLLFPNGDLNDLTAVYERSLGAQVMNALVQQAVSLATAPLQRPVRILEIGAGSGGTTAHLLPHLQDLEGVEYVFTDISPLFLQKAAARFSDYPFVRYVRLDIERSPAKQGFQQPFDLVIAANVLHATADLRQTLDHVYQLLAPGGELVLLENTQPLLWVDLIFGLTDGWWRFTDHDLRPHHPLLSAGQWQQLLQECGFAAGVIQPGDVSAEFRAYELPQAVLVAQRGAATSAGNWLILAASENQGYPLADSLTRQGQSAAVMTLGELRDAADSAPLLQRLQTSSAVQGVVYLGELALSGTVPEACGNACHDVLQLVQTLIKANPIPRLYLATGATDIPENRLARSPLLGLTKTVALEHPELRCTYLEADVDVEALAAELLSNSPEQQVRLGPQRRVARLHPYSLNDSSQSRLIIPEPGTLANLTFQPMSRCTPAADEVEVSVGAAGLNFRDVLMALGQYPSDQPQLGCECAGEVVAVGEAVKDLSVGQRVMG
ncbi:MAG: acyltransferase domain-containing protein, partial [Cyanobacteria bacterium P01_A01_bin.135]